MVIDHDAHALRFLLDAPHDHVGIDVLVDHSEPEQFGETLDRGQWCAQLVRCVGQELAQLGPGPLLGGERLVQVRPRRPRRLRPPLRPHSKATLPRK